MLVLARPAVRRLGQGAAMRHAILILLILLILAALTIGLVL
jgi:hypothetical protein